MPHTDIPGLPGFHDEPFYDDKDGGRSGGGGRGGRGTQGGRPRIPGYGDTDPDVGLDRLIRGLRGSTVVYQGLRELGGGSWTAAQMPGFMQSLRDMGYQGTGYGALDPEWFESQFRTKMVRDIHAFSLQRYRAQGGVTQQDWYEEWLRLREEKGAGGGRMVPIYVAPDRAEVEDNLQAYQVAVTGSLDEGLLASAVDAFMSTHRKDFNSKGQSYDPVTAAKKVIQNSAVYLDIHELRPESTSELTWVTDQQQRLRMVGLDAQQAEALGIKMARIGATREATTEAGERAFMSATGRVAVSQRESLKSTARAVLGLL